MIDGDHQRRCTMDDKKDRGTLFPGECLGPEPGERGSFEFYHGALVMGESEALAAIPAEWIDGAKWREAGGALEAFTSEQVAQLPVAGCWIGVEQGSAVTAQLMHGVRIESPGRWTWMPMGVTVQVQEGGTAEWYVGVGAGTPVRLHVRSSGPGTVFARRFDVSTFGEELLVRAARVPRE